MFPSPGHRLIVRNTRTGDFAPQKDGRHIISCGHLDICVPNRSDIVWSIISAVKASRLTRSPRLLTRSRRDETEKRDRHAASRDRTILDHLNPSPRIMVPFPRRTSQVIRLSVSVIDAINNRQTTGVPQVYRSICVLHY